MPISICDGEDSREQCCGSPCSELSDMEKRRINRQLFLAFPPEEARHSGQRMFIFLRGYDSLVGENIEERRAFPPEEARHSGQRMFVFLRGYDSLVGENIEERRVIWHHFVFLRFIFF
ncbi:unnamed protein product [Strongylus vulgaris]|uniref:Uncharacterized protein n=1 Tax=Strongylus vulgaris TaxID=40348 RepID=A0A3P7J509_STRVU|nr:unnamed protein product [Strongylus vulgaris]